jgi:hypothetical protein
MGLGFVSKKNKKKNKKKKAKPAQAKKDPIVGGKATRDDLTRIANPHYVLFRDYYGDMFQNMLFQMMVMLLGLFGFQRPLLLTKEDPLRNGDLKPSNDLL